MMADQVTHAGLAHAHRRAPGRKAPQPPPPPGPVKVTRVDPAVWQAALALAGNARLIRVLSYRTVMIADTRYSPPRFGPVSGQHVRQAMQEAVEDIHPRCVHEWEAEHGKPWPGRRA
jgi:hypothetical protein